MLNNQSQTSHERESGIYIFKEYFELTKPRLTLFSVTTALLGFYLGSVSKIHWLDFWNTFLSACLIGGGGNALNQYWEHDIDAKMNRTKNRPIPSGKITPYYGLYFGMMLSILGLFYCYWTLNPPATRISFSILFSYVLIYTPLKKKTTYCTLIGAIPGALPPLLGWSAACGSINFQAIILFLIIFFWQMPHFLAISWVCKEDYAKAGLKMTAVLDPNGKRIVKEIIIYTGVLFLVSLLPYFFKLAGPIYFLIAILSGLSFLGFSLYMTHLRLSLHAKKYFLTSLVYLSLLVLFMMADKITP